MTVNEAVGLINDGCIPYFIGDEFQGFLNPRLVLYVGIEGKETDKCSVNVRIDKDVGLISTLTVIPESGTVSLNTAKALAKSIAKTLK